MEDDVLEEARRLLLGREGCGKARSRLRLLAHCLAVGSRCDETTGRVPDLHLRLPSQPSACDAVFLLLSFLVTLVGVLARPRVDGRVLVSRCGRTKVNPDT